ncbi:hypothetical protein [Emticicia sp. BO119]|uniref:hypothetical protein n=1 Tax=Emticicia sp. BO119 TaxID=2757768 RepID=UPI0015F10E42|nr:hypothetical protein [Emticicia sp. BO119]
MGRLFQHRGDVVICCGKSKSVGKNAGKALCIVEVWHGRAMLRGDEENACIEWHKNRKALLLRNWRYFSRDFEFAPMAIKKNFQGIFEIQIPDDVDIIDRPDIMPNWDDNPEFDFDFSVPENQGVCSGCQKEDSITEVYLDGELQDGELCYDCCQKQGYCFGCGHFSAGTMEYDFSNVGAYCEHCQDEIRASYGEDEYDEDFDDEDDDDKDYSDSEEDDDDEYDSWRDAGFE